MRRSLLALFFAVVTGQANAEMAGAGPGAFSCSKFAEDYRQHRELAETVYFSWAQGFMTAYNVQKITTKEPWFDLGALSIDSQKYRLRSYCDTHPLSDYTTAVIDLLFSLPPKWRPSN